MDDLISRQAAIDAMMRLQVEDDEAYGCHIPEGFDGERAKETLEQLPSAQPEITEKQVKEYCESRNLVVLTSEAYHWLKSLKSKAEEFRWNGGGNY